MNQWMLTSSRWEKYWAVFVITIRKPITTTQQIEVRMHECLLVPGVYKPFFKKTCLDFKAFFFNLKYIEMRAHGDLCSTGSILKYNFASQSCKRLKQQDQMQSVFPTYVAKNPSTSQSMRQAAFCEFFQYAWK